VILDGANGPTPRQRGCVCHASGGGNLWFGWLLLMVGVISLLTRRHTRQNRPR
jgi:MYXO-CTERM domain-containing protein